MMQKSNVPKEIQPPIPNSAIWRSLSVRLQRLWLHYPMVVILVLLLVSVTGQNVWGDWWLAAVALAFTICAFIQLILLSCRIRSEVFRFICLALAAGMLAGKLHSMNQKKSMQQIQQWQASQLFELSETSQTGQWSPLACRGIIDTPLRYRKATQFRSSDDPNHEGWQTITTIKLEALRVGQKWEPQSMSIPLTIEGRLRDYFPGDTIELYGVWRLPTRPSNPGQYDQAKRYSELGYAAQAKAESGAQLKRIDSPKWIRLDRYLAMVAAAALDAMEKHVVLGQSELTAALVLGQREQAEWRLQEELLATGTIHMLSISGMHVEMVALSLLLMGHLFQFPRKALLLAVCVFVIAYAMLCGGNPPVARAAMTLSGICLARWMGWTISSMNLLACSGVALILYRPGVFFETGTQLSFLAVAVLILSASNLPMRLNPLERLMDSKSNQIQRNAGKIRRWSLEMLRTSFWVWFITAPIVWHSFHVISPIAILLNLILWLPMLVALMAGLGLILFGTLPVLASPLGWICGVSLWCVENIVANAECIPLGHFWIRSPPLWWMYGFYTIGIFASLLFGVRKTPSKQRLLALLTVWFALGLLLRPAMDLANSIGSPQHNQLAITFLDVGHGTCAIIETPDHQTWLYDAGRLGDHQRSYQVITDALWAMNRPTVDCVIISHADSDHYNAIEGIARRFQIRRMISTKQVYEHPSELLKENIRAATSRGCLTDIWKQGDVLAGNAWSMLAIHPPRQDFAASDNAKSLCVLLEFAGRRILLPGDLEPPGTSILTSQQETDVDILMAPHHGSIHSRSETLLRWCSPEIVIISGSYRALSQRVQESYENADTFITARDHAVRVVISRDGEIQILHWHVDRWAPIP